MKIAVAARKRLYHFFSAYAPQTGCSDQAKDEFWSLLDEKTAEVPPKDVIIIADLNGHIGADGYSCHGGFGYGSRKADGERILEYAESHNLTIVNTVFRKRDSHLISYYSGSSRSQIDFVLVRDRDWSIVTDAKIVPYETVAPQHRPLICTLKIAPPRLKQIERCDAARIKWWRMKEKKAAPGRRKVDKQTWLWTDDVKAKVREKKALYRVFLGEKTAENCDVNEKLVSRDGERYLYRLAKIRHRHTEDIEKFFSIIDESGHLLTDRKKALKRWRDCFEEISTMEFHHPAIPSVGSVHGPVHKITVEETKAALRKMRPGKATGPTTWQLICGSQSCGTMLSGRRSSLTRLWRASRETEVSAYRLPRLGERVPREVMEFLKSS
ncbi:unnamed protein product [Heligmosomoides polygyrus]|uniref:Endo/exonuclease/phosphatase domain-containing protein n=1 Tax=Heligmosomoides polygyrus TaxID=6339 RepID=A0A183FHQ1_HELPZ|nr:unnamed protein product [Heligmosomoides polygyrus]